MHTQTLLILSCALSSLAHPFDYPASRASTNEIDQRDAKQNTGTALGTFGPHGLVGEINADGNAVDQPGGGDNDMDDANNGYVASMVNLPLHISTPKSIFLTPMLSTA